MPKLSIKSDDYGMGLFKDGIPWRYFKSGGDVAALLIAVVEEGFGAADYLVAEMKEEKRIID